MLKRFPLVTCNRFAMHEKQQNPTKKLSVTLDARLHSRAKRYALINDITLTELVIALLEERLNKDSSA